MITNDMRAMIAAQKLCFAATVSPEGRPNLSPKGTIRVWDDDHLFFCDISSPNTRHNLQSSPWIELNIVDPLSRRGYRFLGKGSVHVDDHIYREATARIFQEEGSEYRVHAVILIAVERILPLISPGYQHYSDEWEIRNVWKEKRSKLNKEFEEHIKTEGAWKGKFPQK